MNVTKRFLVPIALALVAVVLVACGAQAAWGYDDLVAALGDAGATVEVVEKEFTQPFFSAAGCVIRVDGQEVQVFDYDSEAAAKEDAALISPAGGSVGTTMLSWIATPHFYQKGSLIALYVGDDAGVLAALQGALGPQVAGG